MQAPHRDLASPELWEVSLERSRRRRVLAAQGRPSEAEASLDEAAVIFDRLGAKPWLERASRLGAGRRVPASAGEA